MLRARDFVAVLVLAACSASPPPAPEAKPAPAAPASDEPRAELELGAGELLRSRVSGGACGDDSVLVVYTDGRVTEVDRDGCYEGGADDPPPPPTVKTIRVGEQDIARLQGLLADPALPQSLAAEPPGNGGSAHPYRQTIIARTPSGMVRGEHKVGRRSTEKSALDLFLDELYVKVRS